MGKNSNKVRLELCYYECNNPSDNSSKRKSRNPFEDKDNQQRQSITNNRIGKPGIRYSNETKRIDRTNNGEERSSKIKLQ